MISTELFKNRPFSLFCALFMLSSLLGFFIIGQIKLFVAALCLAAIVCALIICIIKHRFLRVSAAVLLVSLAVGAGSLSSYFYFDGIYTDMRKYDGEMCDIDAVVVDTAYYSDNATAYTVRLISVNGESRGGLAYLSCNYGCDLLPGYRFSTCSEMSEPSDTGFGYSQKSSLISDGILSVITSESESDYTVTDRNFTSPEIALGKLNAELSARLSRAVGGEAGDLASAMLLADKSELDDKTRLVFSRSGTSHLLALSGLHMAIVAAIAEFFLRKLRVGKTARSVLLFGILLAYLALVGFTVSAVRSVIMICAVYLSYILRAPSEPRTTLFFAGFLILLISPNAVCDVGFWMSFFATLGIILVAPYISRLFAPKRKDGDVKIFLLRALKYLISAIVVTLTANFAVLFFSWLFFGQVSLAAPLSNLLLAPISTLLIWSSALTLLFYFPAPGIASIFASCAAFFGDILLAVCAYFSDIKDIVLSLRYDFAGPLICLFCAAMIVLLVIRLKHKLWALLPAAALVLSFTVCLFAFGAFSDKKTEVSYVKSKDGEVFVLSQGGKAVVCDASEGYYSRLYLAGAVSRGHCATEVEVLLLTHYHSRQPQSIKKFLNNFKTRAVWIPEPMNEYEFSAMQNILSVCRATGIDTVIYRHGEKMTVFGDTEIELFPYRKLDRSVEAQVGFTAVCGGSRLTYLCSSFFEGDPPEDIDIFVKNTRYLILGTHGPKAKETAVIELDSSCESVVLADGEAMDEGLIRLYGEKPPKLVCSPEYAYFLLE